ncbi:ATP-binding cassette domain-containing protein [Rummeliibacillus pycnus]|uniref:ATP-binding cassette domain-containing protein n=1 Tax=Rummeliibacillus pycnus TaxID=101070 RepID=UPI0037C96AEA
MTVIECSNVQKKFKRKDALSNITFQLEENKIMGLIGRNGAGKTTLLQLLAGMTKPTSGVIKVFGETPFNNLFVSANSIYIHDQMQFPGSFTLQDILETAANFYGNWDGNLANKLISYFSLDPQAYHSDLSKGMKNTFNFILGLSTHCALTLFDEPINGMDEAVRKDVYRALLKDYIANPRTIIISSHFLEEMEHLLEVVLLIDQGIVVFNKSLEEIQSFALALQGPTDAIQKWTVGLEKLEEKQIALGYAKVLLRAEDCTFDERALQQEDITISSVSASEVYMYMTNTRDVGIDELFN